MIENWTILVFPEAMRKFAESHGATFDKKSGYWGIYGEVPNELFRFIVQAARTRDYVAESKVQCVCGCLMVVRNNRSTGELFWRCSSPRCPRTRPIDYAPVSGLSESDLSPPPTNVIEFEDRPRAEAIYRRAVQDLRGTGAATKWLRDKKVSLRHCGETPLEAIKTSAGCARVELLLDQLFGE
jgi:hypothetical protein